MTVDPDEVAPEHCKRGRHRNGGGGICMDCGATCDGPVGLLTDDERPSKPTQGGSMTNIEVTRVAIDYDYVGIDPDTGQSAVTGLPYRATTADGLHAAATSAEGARAMIERMRAARR